MYTFSKTTIRIHNQRRLTAVCLVRKIATVVDSIANELLLDTTQPVTATILVNVALCLTRTTFTLIKNSNPSIAGKFEPIK